MRAIMTFLQDAFRIRPDEVRRTTLAFVYLFHAIGALIIARITRTTLFLEIDNYREQLPLTYPLIAISVSSIMYMYSRVERKLRRDHTNAITLSALIAVTLLFRITLQMGHSWQATSVHKIYWVFFIWVEVFQTFLIVQFWSFINEIFHSRQAKRLFAIIGGGGVLANIFVGFGIRGLVKFVGTENLLFFIVGALVISLWCVLKLGGEASGALISAKERAPTQKKGAKPISQKVFTTRHVQLIALVVVLTYVVSTIVDYQFNVIVGNSIAGKDARTAYYATFFGVTGIIGAVIQFTMTSRILERFGVLFALMLLPACMMMGSVGIAFMSAGALLWTISFTKGSENVLRYTVNDSTLQLLYLPVPSHIRGRAKAFIDGILKPTSIGGTGLILAILMGSLPAMDIGMSLSIAQVSWFAAGGLILWVLALLVLRREYLKSLVQTLQKRRLNFEDAGFQINDEGTLKTLETALASNNMGEILHALELMPHVARKARGSLTAKVTDLLRNESREVRVAALEYLNGATDDYADFVEPLLDDSAHQVRAAAIAAYCSDLKEKSIARVEPMLEDWDDKVQAAAVAGLIRNGGLDGVLACAHLLKRWLESDLAEDRERAAWILGEVGLQNFYQPLVPLLHDDDEQVRIAAVTAAGKLKNAELIEPLIEQLERPRLRGPASHSLVAYGSQIEDIVGIVLTDTQRPTEVRTQACKILARLGDSHSAGLLSRHVVDDIPQIRTAAVMALTSIGQRLPGLTRDSKLIDDALRFEANRWFETLALALDLELGEQSKLLRDALDNRLEGAKSQLLLLLSLKYSPKTIDLVRRNLKSSQATTRANAVEVLDNILEKEEKAFLIPMLDDASREKTLQAGTDIFEIPRTNRQERLKSLLQGPDPWLRAAAALEVATAKLKSLEPQIRALLDNEDAVCRETAAYVLWQLSNHDELREHLEPLREDSAPNVRAYATFLLEQPS